MKTKSKIAALALAAVLGVATVVATVNLSKEAPLANIQATNNDDYVLHQENMAALASSGSIDTALGNPISFFVDQLDGANLAKANRFYNTTPITGLKSVSITSTGQIFLAAGYINESIGVISGIVMDSVTDSGNVTLNFSSCPDYFYIFALEDTVLSNLSICYECEVRETYSVTVNLKFEENPLAAVYLCYDHNFHVDDDWINGKPGCSAIEMNWVDAGGYYSAQVSGLRPGYFRYMFNASPSYGVDRYISFDAEWHPAQLAIVEDRTIWCTVDHAPASADQTTVFVPSSNSFLENATIELYTVNDFHGYVDEDDGHAGIEKFGTYFKERGEEPNTLLLDQGDSWQGEMNSSFNKGRLVTDVMNYAHFDARTVGNHDFDWGVDALIANTARNYGGYSTPVLGANIYDYNFETKQAGTTHQDDICQSSVSYTLENGLKVGIVGVIGHDQVTSITSTYVQDIAFLDHIQFIKDEAAALREDGCDVVICSIHAGQEDVMGHGLGDYVDVVLCGHTHRSNERGTDPDGLQYFQFYKNGMQFGHITLSYNYTLGKATVSEAVALSASAIKSAVSEVDPVIHGLYEAAKAECAEAANEVVVKNNVNGLFTSDGRDGSAALPNLMNKAIIEAAEKEFPDDEILFSYTNYGRADMPNGEPWKYSDIYESMPFENLVYILEAPGSEIINELGYNYVCWSENHAGTVINKNDYYKVAVTDYIAFHTNASRQYNFWPYGAKHVYGVLSKDYRTIVCDYLVEKGYTSGAATLSAADFIKDTHNEFDPKNYKVRTTFEVDNGVEVTRTYVDSYTGVTYDSIYPETPAREGYSFAGWKFSNGNDTSGVKVNSSYVIHAEFTPINPLKVTGTYAELKALADTNSVQIGDEVKVTIVKSGSVEDQTDYSEIGILAETYLTVTAASGYRISEIEVMVWGTHDNLTFKDGSSLESDELAKTVNATTYAGKDARQYFVEPSGASCIINNPTNYRVSAYYIAVTLAEIS